MPRFFNRIRKQLAKENKFFQYSRYAIGEILLVVIGILIALQLDEWKNDEIDNRQKQIILNALKLEFEDNLIQLDSSIYYNNKILVAYSSINELIKSSFKGYSEDEIKLLVADLSWTWTFNPVNGALHSATSSGEIHLIDNKRLVELLFNWEGLVEDSYEEAERMRQFQYDKMDMLSNNIRVFDAYSLYYSHMDSSNYTSDYNGLFQDPKFEDYRSASYFFAWEYIQELKILREFNLELLTLIDQEIKE
jgi:hypothetical protein